jgi:5'-3' exonuclease
MVDVKGEYDIIVVDSKLLMFTLYHKYIPYQNYLSYLYYFLKDVKYKKLVFVFDDILGSVHRKTLYPEYKGHRKTSVKEPRLEHMLDLYNNKLYEYLQHFGTCIKLSGVEADDIAAFITESYEDSDKQILLASSDADWGSLITDNVHQLHFSRKKIITVDTYEEEYKMLIPTYYLDYQYLAGMKKENVYGIYKLGKARYCKAVSETNTHDELLNLIQEWVDESKYGMKLPEGYNNVKEVYDMNKAILRHLKLNDLQDDVLTSFKKQFNTKCKCVSTEKYIDLGIKYFNGMSELNDDMLQYYRVIV